MKINRAAILEFYDKRRSWSAETGSPVSAVTATLGEDLVLGLLCQHLGGKILSYGCKPEGNAGSRLDAWVTAGRKLYQVEVKNWCAHSIGGASVPEDPRALRKVAEENLIEFLTQPRNLNAIWKVLGPMIPPVPVGTAKPIPMLALWAPVALPKQRSNSLPPWFDCDLSDYAAVIPEPYRNVTHRKVSIFSASLYLRTLKSRVVNIPMARAEHRLREFGNLITL